VGQPNLISRATGETHFFMVYGAEAVLPPEVTMDSLRVKTYDEAMQNQLRREDIDLVDEQRWQAAIKNARYHAFDRRSGATTSGSYEAGSSKWMI
jgi:hypothetical protein